MTAQPDYARILHLGGNTEARSGLQALAMLRELQTRCWSETVVGAPRHPPRCQARVFAGQ